MSMLGTVKHVPKDVRYAFLNMPAPSSYVAGLGRGASGFTTRSDIGPARQGPSDEAVAEAQAKRGEDVPDPDALQDPDDERNLFAGTVYEADDEEADRIWESVDARIDGRRKARREAVESEQAAKERANNPKLQTQFADLKRNLSTLDDAAWNSIPEAGNLTGKRRKRNMRLEENQNGKSYVVSDTVMADAVGRKEMVGELADGMETPMPGAEAADTDFISIGNARDKVLSLKLDQVRSHTLASQRQLTIRRRKMPVGPLPASIRGVI